MCKGILLSFNVFVDAQSFEFETNGHSIYKVIYFGVWFIYHGDWLIMASSSDCLIN